MYRACQPHEFHMSIADTPLNDYVSCPEVHFQQILLVVAPSSGKSFLHVRRRTGDSPGSLRHHVLIPWRDLGRVRSVRGDDMGDHSGLHRLSGRWPRTLGILLASLLALVLIGPIPHADATPAPTTGRTRGGTVVTDKLPGSSFKKVVAAYTATWALGTDGSAYGWGDNTGGKWGDGSIGGNSTTPMPSILPAGITFTDIAGSANAAAAIGSDGNVYTWGSNSYGTLGVGSTNDNATRATPTRLTTLPSGVKFTQLDGGNWHVIALASDGRAYGWGRNNNGQLGNGQSGTNAYSLVAVAMPSGVTFTEVTAGSYHSLAIGSDGNVWAWGINRQGQLGNGSSADSSRPVKVALPAGVKPVEIAGGWQNSAIVASDGRIYTWGDGDSGQLGNGSGRNSSKPVAITMPAGVTFTKVAVGKYHMVALDSNGDVWSWGDNSRGLLGTGDYQSHSTPVRVVTGKHITEVSASDDYSMVTASDGAVFGWGQNITGVLGNGSSEPTPAPTPVVSGATVTSVTFGGVVGTGLSQDGLTWTATTPGGCGPVDVVVNYTLRGTQHSSRYAGGFTYATTPVITSPATASAGPGAGRTTVSAAATGDNDPGLVPAVQWQGSATSTGPWTNIPGATSATAVIPTTSASWVQAVFTNCSATATTAAVRLSTDVGVIGTKVVPAVGHGDPVLDKAGADPANWQLTATANGVTTPIGAGDGARLERGVGYVIGERLRTNPAPDAVASRYERVGQLACTDANGAALPPGVVDAVASTVTLGAAQVIAEPIRCSIDNQAAQASLLVKQADGSLGAPGDGWSLAASAAAPSDVPGFTLDARTPATIVRRGTYSATISAPAGVALAGIEALDVTRPACAAQANTAARAPEDCWTTVSAADTTTLAPGVGTHVVYRLVATAPAAMPPLPLTGGLGSLGFMAGGVAAVAVAGGAGLVGSRAAARSKRPGPPIGPPGAPQVPGEQSAE
ncbi:hypothetical protein EFN79_05535 [Propionibacterium freudenreichii]|nr:hypothetical protein [Propionibacterium freudenreichii]MCT2985330.1 hypothetical protein [Propionibacterium freudenreichii]MCT2986712.1 hypothetical protein [Propionibacterium freudenreichii]